MGVWLTQGDLPQSIGCPILRVFCEGWGKQKFRGRVSGGEQWHPTLRQQREGWGTRYFVAGQEIRFSPAEAVRFRDDRVLTQTL
jgi:hypothetical protein